MKKIFLTLVILIFAAPMFSQTTKGDEIKRLMRAEGYSLSEGKYAYLSEGESARYWRTFYADNEYVIIAYSEAASLYDLDIYLYDNDGSLLSKSSSSDDIEIIQYTPYVSREMKVVIKNYDSGSVTTNYKCRFLIFYK